MYYAPIISIQKFVLFPAAVALPHPARLGLIEVLQRFAQLYPEKLANDQEETEQGTEGGYSRPKAKAKPSPKKAAAKAPVDDDDDWETDADYENTTTTDTAWLASKMQASKIVTNVYVPEGPDAPERRMLLVNSPSDFTPCLAALLHVIDERMLPAQGAHIK